SRGALNGEGLKVQREDSIEVCRMHMLVDRMMKSLKPEERERMFPRGVTDTFATELYDFYNAIVEKRKPEVDGWEAYKDMAIPLSFYESATLRKPVKVKDVEELKLEEYQGEINERLGVR
ncbi:hypothetical protein KEJ25_01670, partial [Candidatus Bathyarchaeota archaeon]|nr:hypothetical protein [Candidatus Bathyarchaeota archaeon]